MGGGDLRKVGMTADVGDVVSDTEEGYYKASDETVCGGYKPWTSRHAIQHYKK